MGDEVIYETEQSLIYLSKYFQVSIEEINKAVNNLFFHLGIKDNIKNIFIRTPNIDSDNIYSFSITLIVYSLTAVIVSSNYKP